MLYPAWDPLDTSHSHGSIYRHYLCKNSDRQPTYKHMFICDSKTSQIKHTNEPILVVLTQSYYLLCTSTLCTHLHLCIKSWGMCILILNATCRTRLNCLTATLQLPIPHVVSWPIYRLAVSGDLVMTTGLVYRPQLMWSTSSTGPLGDSLQTSPSPLKKKIWNRMINFFRNQDLKSTDYESAMYSSRGYTKIVHKSVINEIL